MNYWRGICYNTVKREYAYSMPDHGNPVGVAWLTQPSTPAQSTKESSMNQHQSLLALLDPLSSRLSYYAGEPAYQDAGIEMKC